MSQQSDAELMLRLVLDRRFGSLSGIANLRGETFFDLGSKTWSVPTVNGLPVLTPELRAELERLDGR